MKNIDADNRLLMNMFIRLIKMIKNVIFVIIVKTI